jgi:hypothetical protein
MWKRLTQCEKAKEGEHFMQKVHKSDKYTAQRSDEVLLLR